LEANFGENFATGLTAATPSPIATNTSSVTTLAGVGNLFELYPDSGGPLLELNGSVVTAGSLGSWTPVGAVQTGTGYEVAFSNGQGQYTVWNVASNGNFAGGATGGPLSSTVPTQELEGLEASFGE